MKHEYHDVISAYINNIPIQYKRKSSILPWEDQETYLRIYEFPDFNSPDYEWRIKPKDEYEEDVERAISSMNWGRIHTVMTALNYTWYIGSLDKYEVPVIPELKKHVTKMCFTVLKDPHDQFQLMSSGFTVSKTKDANGNVSMCIKFNPIDQVKFTIL